VGVADGVGVVDVVNEGEDATGDGAAKAAGSSLGRLLKSALETLPVINNITDAMAVTQIADFRLRKRSHVRLPRMMATIPVTATISEITANTGERITATPRATMATIARTHVGSFRFRLADASAALAGGVRLGGVENDILCLP